MEAQDFDAWLQANRCLYGKQLPDGRYLTVQPLGSVARLTLSRAGDWSGWAQAWDFRTTAHAIWAAQCWDGEGDPLDGWERHLPSNRFRPGGDPARECLLLYDVAVDPVTLCPLDPYPSLED